MADNTNTPLKGATLLVETVLITLLYAAMLAMYGQSGDKDAKTSTIIVGITYLFTVFNGGVILYKKNTDSWQVALLVLGNTAKFAVLSTVLLYVSGACPLSASMLACFYLGQFAVATTYRLVIHNAVRDYRRADAHVRKVVLVGSSANNKELYDEMTGDPYLGYRVEGYFDYAPNPAFPEGCRYLGTPEGVTAYLSANKGIKGLYCCLPSKDERTILPIIHHCVNNMIGFYSVPNVRNYVHNRMFFNMVGNVPCLSLYTSPLSNIGNRMVKRAFDVAVSLTFLCTLFPIIFVIVAIITKTTMPGPIFFRQRRNGLNGKAFYCIKFRSMKVNADSDRLQATKDDPRKTKWGDIMRRTSIDELPQFINVLMGSMSVVGPRPHMERHTDEYSKLIDKYMLRHVVKPGITGWSQVTGFRGETRELWQMEGRVRGDIWYLEHWSLGLDLYIMYKTVANALKGDDEAY